GWSETGGPWVPPKDGLKKLVWSETVIRGGRKFTGKLAAPPAVTGVFQSLPIDDPMAALSGARNSAGPTYYSDVAVLAYPVADSSDAPLPQVTANAGEQIDAAKLNDGDFNSGVDIQRGTAEQPGTLVLTYSTPRTIRSATLYIPGKTAFTDI